MHPVAATGPALSQINSIPRDWRDPAAVTGVRMAAALQHEAVPLGPAGKPAVLEVVPQAAALVLMAPRSRLLRSRRHQRRLLDALHARGLATLGLDTPAQLLPAVHWLARRPDLAGLPLGLWLDRQAALQALELAARQPARVGAVVVVDALLDAEASVLPQVHAATLLMQLGADPARMAEQHKVLARLRCNKRLESVPLPASGAAAEGAVEALAQIGSAWMATHLSARRML